MYFGYAKCGFCVIDIIRKRQEHAELDENKFLSTLIDGYSWLDAVMYSLIVPSFLYDLTAKSFI